MIKDIHTLYAIISEAKDIKRYQVTRLENEYKEGTLTDYTEGYLKGQLYILNSVIEQCEKKIDRLVKEGGTDNDN